MTDAFDDKVRKLGGSECWPWQGAKNAKGYGNFRSRSAHVVAYERAHGPVPSGLEIDHICRNRPCVNPAHLEAVTHQENVRRHMEQVTHCKEGHPLTGDNVKLKPMADGVRRQCRECSRRWKREWGARSRAIAAKDKS